VIGFQDILITRTCFASTGRPRKGLIESAFDLFSVNGDLNLALALLSPAIWVARRPILSPTCFSTSDCR
jgi:hypothetical protein